MEVVDEAVALEGPAALVAVGVDEGDPDRVLEALEVAHDHRALRPRAGAPDVEVVAPGLGAVARGAVGAHPVGEAAALAHEAPIADLEVGLEGATSLHGQQPTR